tara:strand:+ start:139 stop:468 length:330 start_codon:yes stop_codon:yes gene_type:complete
LSKLDLSKLPQKKYHSISEVSSFLKIKQTEMRYWEKFEPKLKSKSTTRKYNLRKIKLLLEIKELIYEQGVKPSKISLHLKAKKVSHTLDLGIKEELIKIRNNIKKASKL